MKPVINKYRRWDTDNGKFETFLRENYLKYDNRTIAYMMGRTLDSVRKQLKKMHLKRPRKTKSRTGAPLKRGRKKKEKTIFDMRSIGIQYREAIQREKEKIIRIECLKKAEKKRYDRDFSDPVIPSAPSTDGKCYLTCLINGKETTIFGDKYKIAIYADKCKRKSFHK